MSDAPRLTWQEIEQAKMEYHRHIPLCAFIRLKGRCNCGAEQAAQKLWPPVWVNWPKEKSNG